MIRIEEELVVNNKTIDARILSRMFLAGAKNLEAKKEWINELNGTGWRYRNQYDNDDHGSSSRSRFSGRA